MNTAPIVERRIYRTIKSFYRSCDQIQFSKYITWTTAFINYAIDNKTHETEYAAAMRAIEAQTYEGVQSDYNTYDEQVYAYAAAVAATARTQDIETYISWF